MSERNEERTEKWRTEAKTDNTDKWRGRVGEQSMKKENGSDRHDKKNT